MCGGTILCYGDSNTFGYDPRDPLGGCYEPEEIFPARLSRLSGRRVINGGLNGAVFPRPDSGWPRLTALMERWSPSVLFVMLGTNDLLLGHGPERIAGDGGALLDFCTRRFPHTAPVLLAPPPLPEAWEDREELTELLSALCFRRRILFRDTGLWRLSLAYDGVHLSPEGHRRLAEELDSLLTDSGL